MAEQDPETRNGNERFIRDNLKGLHAIGGWAVEIARNLNRAHSMLSDKLPLEAPEGTFFTVKPTAGNKLLTVRVMRADGSTNDEIFSDRQRLHSTERQGLNSPIQSDERGIPLYLGKTIEMDPELMGRCNIISEDGKMSVLYNPEINYVTIVSSEVPILQ